MLGKGLESLIPQKGNQGAPNNNTVSPVQPPHERTKSEENYCAPAPVHRAPMYEPRTQPQPQQHTAPQYPQQSVPIQPSQPSVVQQPKS